MPKFLEAKLKKEYGSKSSVPYKVMNAIGAMKGNKETPKGAAMEAKHVAKTHGDPGTAERVTHVHEHLQTPHVEPHQGVTIHGEEHTGNVAGSLSEHRVYPGLIAHFEKGKGH